MSHAPTDTGTAALAALSPLDGRYAGKLRDLAALFSEQALIGARVAVEIHWLLALADEPGLPEIQPFSGEARARLASLVSDFSADDAARVKAIEATTNHDVKAVEYFLRERLHDSPECHRAFPFIHFACTSEDINNLSYGLLTARARTEVLVPLMGALCDAVAEAASRYADEPMLARTHGQPASPTTVGKEFANFGHRLDSALADVKLVPITGKLNGAVGNYNAHRVAYPEVDWIGLSERFVSGLGLTWAPLTTQIEPHDHLARLCHALMRFNQIVLQMDRDLWGYISLGYFRQRTKASEVGSSTMPHKVNPIDFENSEGNIGIANSLLSHLAAKLPVSRWQRDLTDSTALRNVGSALGYMALAVQSASRGLAKLDVNRARLQGDLEAVPEVLAEAIQTVMRRYGMDDAYEQLKALTRGKDGLTLASLRGFVSQLALPDDAKNRLLSLAPSGYTGDAATLVQRYLSERRR